MCHRVLAKNFGERLVEQGISGSKCNSEGRLFWITGYGDYHSSR